MTGRMACHVLQRYANGLLAGKPEPSVEPACGANPLWYGPAAVRGPGRIVSGCALAALLGAGALAGCGGGQRQDANEPSGDFQVDVVKASFPTRQHLAKQEHFVVAVRNSGAHAVPDLALTVDSFSHVSQQAALADPSRPTWIVDRGPVGGDTAYTDTWALGRVGPGQTRTFDFKVTPVLSGTHKVTWRVAAGLNGKARAVTSGHGIPVGTFTVAVSGRPARATVDPVTGKVIRK
jgi:hypothetical protein